MISPRALAAILLSLSLAACYPLSSKNPLGNASSGEDLVGVWEDPDGEIRFEFTRKGRKALTLRVAGLEEDEDEILFYAIKPSRIEGKAYMSVMQYFPKESIEAFAKSGEISYAEAKSRLKGRDKRMNGYYLAYYSIEETEEGDDLKIFLMDTDSTVVAEALEAGELRGGAVTVKTEKGEEDDILYLTSSTRTLTSFVASYTDNPEELFTFELGELLRKE